MSSMTVAEFASELKKSTDTLLAQLKSAGVAKAAASDTLTDADKQRLVARSLADYFPPRSYGVVMRKGKYLSPQARDFVDLVKPGLFQRRDYFDSGHSER